MKLEKKVHRGIAIVIQSFSVAFAAQPVFFTVIARSSLYAEAMKPLIT